MNTSYQRSLYLLLFFLPLSVVSAFTQSANFETQIQTLFDRLDAKALPSSISNQSDPQKKVTELLRYYKKRNTVKHPVNTTASKQNVTEKDLKYANDALEHVFVGQPAYPSHFCGEDINWNARPVPDNEWVWQLNRMYFWNSMGKVYTATGDERYAREWGAQLIDWTQKNPRDEEHHYAWRSIEAGIRGHNWSALFFRFIQSEHFTPEVLVALMNSCYDHAEYLMTRYSSGSNWSLMEAEGMAFIAFTFPEFRQAGAWKTEAIRRFSNELHEQVYDDGHQRELAMGYHLGCIRWFYRTYELAKLNGQANAFPADFAETMEKMCEVPMKLCLPDGTNAQFGDSWAGTPGQYNDRFLEWAALFDREDFRFLGSEGQAGQAPTQTAYALKTSGLFSLRSGWDENATCMVLKCGPDGGGHSQPDNGTFTLYAGGRTLMPDAGSYIYSGDPEGRAWFRQSKVHQTLTLNGENTRYAPRLLQWKPGSDLDILVVENDSYDNLTHRRAVFFVDKRYFIIVDEAVGTGTGDVDIHFQLAPGDAVFSPKKFSVRSDHAEGWNIWVQTQKQKGLELSEEEGKVSFIYTKLEPRPAFRYRLKKTSATQSVRFVTVVAPYQAGIPDIKCKVLGKSKREKNKLQLLVKEKGKKTVLECDW